MMRSIFQRPLQISLVALLGLICLFGTSASVAQDFYIEGSAPAHGSADVPLEATIVFEYNRATGYSTTDWHTAVVEPRNKIRITQAHLCLGPETCGDGDEPRYVHYHVQHEPDTDYTWIIYSTRTFDDPAKEDTVWMAEPYVLRYSTAPDVGPFEVEGSVEVVQPRADVASQTQELLQSLISQVEETDIGRNVRLQKAPAAFPSTERPAGPAMSLNAVEQSSTRRPEDHTFVLLLEAFSLFEQNWSVEASTVIQGDHGEYAVEFVREGTFWPLAVRFADPDRTEVAGIGFYDENGDRTPDPIIVEDASVGSVDVTMFDHGLSTVRANLGLAMEKAYALASDQRLVSLRSHYGARTSGKAYNWRYRFHSSELDKITTVMVSPFDAALTVSSAEPALAQSPALPAAFIDSDEALGAVMEEGGQDFIDENAYSPRNLSTLIEGRFFDGSDPLWYVRITGRTTSETKTFERWVDMQSGEVATVPPVLAGTTEEEIGIRIGPNFPNPFTGSTNIPLLLDDEQAVSLTVYDALGRRVATLLDQEVLPEGRHTIRWQGGSLPSGVYFYQLKTARQTLSGAMTLQR